MCPGFARVKKWNGLNRRSTFEVIADNVNTSAGLPPYTNWKDIYGVTADTEDLDHDGISALVEFCNGSRPDSAGSVFFPAPLLVPDGGMDHFGIRFRIAKGIPGLTHAIESSESLPGAPQAEGEESEVVIGDTVLVSSTDNPDGTCTLVYRLTSPMASMPQRFLRVKFDYAE